MKSMILSDKSLLSNYEYSKFFQRLFKEDRLELRGLYNTRRNLLFSIKKNILLKQNTY